MLFRSGWGLQIDHKLTSIGAREEGKAQEGEDRETQCEEDAKRGQCDDRSSKRETDQLVIQFEKRFEASVEPDVKSVRGGPVALDVIHRNRPFG